MVIIVFLLRALAVLVAAISGLFVITMAVMLASMPLWWDDDGVKVTMDWQAELFLLGISLVLLGGGLFLLYVVYNHFRQMWLRNRV